MESEQRKKGGCGGLLIVFIGIIAVAFLVVQRVTLKEEIQLYGQWQMTDESWEAELKYRESWEDGFDNCFYKCVSFSGPNAASPLKARFVAFDNGLKPPYERISGTFTYYDNDKIYCLALMATDIDVKYERVGGGAEIEWVDFNTIVVRGSTFQVRSDGNNLQTRTYRRISAQTSGE